MNARHKRLATATTLLLVFSIAQVYIGASFAGADPRPGGVAATTMDLTGVLVTSGKQAILVNGNNAVTDATILSGASIQTPQGVSATVHLDRLGSLDISSETSLRLDFTSGRIKVSLFKGCVILRTRRGTTGTVETANGVIGITDPSKDDVLDVCQHEGAAPLVNQGAAANAGAGASGAGSAASAAGGAATAGGLSQTAGVLIGVIGGGAMIAGTFLVLPCDRAADPSPSVGTHCR